MITINDAERDQDEFNAIIGVSSDYTNDAERDQDEFNAIIGVLSDCTPRGNKYIEANNKLQKNVKTFYEGREKIIKGFKDGIFPFDCDEALEEQATYEEEEKNIRDKNDLIDYRRLNKLIYAKTRDINDELVRKHFLVQDLEGLLEKLWRSKNDPKKNKIQLGLINSGLRDLKEEIEDMGEQEKQIENTDEIVNLLENILEINRQQ